MNEQINDISTDGDPVDGFYDGPASQALDEAARVGLPIDGIDLMCRAARAALDVVVSEYPEAMRLLIVCGSGNNAGDGYLLAALAQEQGLKPSVLPLISAEDLKGDVALAEARARSAGVVILEVDADPSQYDVVIDAMLGTGFKGEVRPAYVRAIEQINASGISVVSVDVPSGVDASTGRAGSAIQADHTVTFISQKLGTATGPGKSRSGRVHLAGLGVPKRLYTSPSAQSCRWDPAHLKPLADNAYKHELGHVLVVGGDLGMPGAVAMAGEAVLRVGAGMVSFATRIEHSTALVARLPEAMTIDPQGDGLAVKLNQIDLVVLGPGLGRGAWGRSLYELVEASGKPTVLDADGLFWLANAQSWGGGELFVTPHSAEAARLIGVTVGEIDDDRVACANEIARRYQARVNLKGPGSIVRLSDRVEVCRHGNPGMATAGMGDVLSGIVGGLLATAVRQGESKKELDGLFSLSIALHSAAADQAAASVGMRSLLATDVIRALPGVIHGD
ncbi:MAG: NAD(P)H-hydrate dehydratase [Pseudomonadales bacterium]|nr:NAD(P)H-hydrate dehydratase [Pseudomonadales bacterium]